MSTFTLDCNPAIVIVWKPDPAVSGAEHAAQARLVQHLLDAIKAQAEHEPTAELFFPKPYSVNR